MKIIISPAKKMRYEEVLPPESTPLFLSKTREILSYLKSLDYGALKKLWGVNEMLMAENWERLREIDLDSFGSAALLSYDGIQYTYMSPSTFEDAMFAYAKEHLRILSAFYGVLRPFDRVVPYRLEMQAKAKVNGTKDLYGFWGDVFYRNVLDEDRTIVNLASEEYGKAVLAYVERGDRIITPVFAEMVEGKPVTKGVYAKMARGEMVRFMAENSIGDIEEIKGFAVSGYHYREELSSPGEWFFVREENRK